MKWFKLISLSLLLSVLILICSIFLLQQDHYKQIMVWGAEQFLDTRLIIDGPLDFEISRNLTLSSSDIIIHADDDSYRLVIGKLYVSFRLGSYLQTGSFWFNYIELDDIQLKVNESSDDNASSLEDLRIPPVVINQASLNNIRIVYQEMAPGTAHTILLDRLVLDELSEHKPVTLQATGLIETEPFAMTGTFGSAAQLINKQEPANLDIVFNSKLINLSVKGSIAEPVKGHGMDLEVHGDILRLNDFLEIIWDGIPELGSMQGALSLRGDYSAPQIYDIGLHLQHEQQVDLKLTGSVDNIVEGKGFDIQFTAKSDNQNVLSWVLSDHYDRMKSLQLSGKLEGNLNVLTLQNINATASTLDDLKLQANGRATLYPEGYTLTKKDAALSLKFSAPSTNTANLFNVDNIPELGPISANMVLAINQDAVGIYNLVLDIGHTDQNRMNFQGDIGVVPFTEDPSFSGLNLQSDIHITDFVELGQQLGVELPELGTGHLRGKLITKGSSVELQNARLDIFQGKQLVMNASGSITTNQHDPSIDNMMADLSLNLIDADITELNRLIDFEIPPIGPLSMRANLVIKDAQFDLLDMNLFFGTNAGTNLLATGRVGTHLRDLSKLTIATHVEFQSTKMSQLAKIYDYELPEMGSTRITAWFESRESELHVEDIVILVGTEQHADLRARGSIVTSLEPNATSINVNYEVATSPLIAMFSELQPKSLGMLQGNAVIADLDGDWGIESFNITSANTELYDIQLSGRYDDMENYDEGQINSSIAINNPHKLAQALGFDFNGEIAYRQKGMLSFQEGRLNYQGEASLGKTSSQSNVSGYLKESKPVFEGTLQIPVLYLADLGFGSEVLPDKPLLKEKKNANPYIFSRESFDIGFLSNFDFDLELQIDEVESGDLTIDSVNGRFKLENGFMDGSLDLVFEGGKTEIDFDVLVETEPQYTLTVTADDLMLGPVLTQIQEQVPVNGYTNINLKLQSRGNSQHQIASNLDGEAIFGLENIRIPNHIVKLLSVDVFGWVLSKGSQDTHANLNCVVMNFDVSQGLVKSAVIIADGPRLSIGGKVDLNLTEETLDIVLIPKQKRRLFSSASPVKISGPMRDPEVKAVPMRAAVQQVGSFMVLGTGLFIPVAIVSSVWSQLGDNDKVGGGCDKLEEIGEMAIEKVQQENQN